MSKKLLLSSILATGAFTLTLAGEAGAQTYILQGEEGQPGAAG